MSLRIKLLSLIGCCALAFVIFGLVSWTTINKVKINGNVYNRIAQEKDLIADILPPPEYLVEAYLVIHQMVEETDNTKLQELVHKSKKLREEYDERHKYWANNLPDSPLKTELIATSYKPAIEYFKIQDEQVIPAISRNDRDAARQIIRTSMKARYEEHRVAIDKVVKMSSDLLQKDEQEIREVVNSRTSLLLILGFVIFFVIVICGFFMNYVSVSIVGRIKQISKGLIEGAQLAVSTSAQIASTSQNVAEGASEQAASLEETSSSLEEMTSMTKQNSNNAISAKTLMEEAKRIVNKLEGQMSLMDLAMKEVTASSEETGKIVKTIDEIAFQTNLLALNAAVEAARAGEAGAGFAVVANEVRNLAIRAAEAAKNTSNLIENTVATVRKSSELTLQTQEAFQENVKISSKARDLVDEIAAASDEQAQGIGQISIAVSEMDKVVQQTATNAEESAGMAEIMNTQAEQLKRYVEQLAEVVGGSNQR